MEREETRCALGHPPVAPPPGQNDLPPQVVVVNVVVVVVATGEREALGGRWGGLSVPKPPKGVARLSVSNPPRQK
jgi:hypothetical protein